MPEPLTDEQVKEWERKIDAMSHVEMCRLWRFAKSGHPVFVTNTPLSERFDKRFKEFGGFTPAISKQIGWGT